MKMILSLLLCSSLFAGSTQTDCNCDQGKTPQQGQGQGQGQAQDQAQQKPQDQGKPTDQGQPAKTGQDSKGNPCTCDAPPKKS